jgi:hypothetical protein
VTTETIEIIVSPTGQTHVETRGFSGSACQDASRFIEQALGQRTQETFTAEYHASQTAGQEVRQQQ